MYKKLLNENISSGFRLIPFSTVSSDGLIPIKSMQVIKITDENGNCKDVRACIGITGCDTDEQIAIFNPGILS